MATVFNNVSYNSHCRVCMLECIDESDIFHDIFDRISDKFCSYSESISFCTGLKISKDDGLPSIICEPCINDLRITHRFIKTSLITNKRLHTPQQKLLIPIYTPLEEEVCDVVYKEVEQLEVSPRRNDRIEKVNGRVKNTSKKKTQKKSVIPKSKHHRCTLCNISFGSSHVEYKKHKLKFHPYPVKASSICEVCGKSIVRGYNRHLLTHKESMVLCCEHCQYKTSNKYLLATHMGVHFKTRSFQCEYCSATPTSLANLRAHIKRNHTNDRNFKCAQCGRAFCYKSELQQHLDFHMGIKRYHCDKCDKMYSDLQDLKKHLSKIHEIVTLKSKSGPKTTHDIIGTNKHGEVLLVAKKII